MKKGVIFGFEGLTSLSAGILLPDDLTFTVHLIRDTPVHAPLRFGGYPIMESKKIKWEICIFEPSLLI
jgi:hypothetical protein